MLNNIKQITILNTRGFKNFGHKRVPESHFTTIWHGFLTLSFIGFGLEWKRLSKFFFGEEVPENKDSPLDLN